MKEKINFMPGDVLVASRGLYNHYGIYCGNGVVVHFAADSANETSAKNAFIQKVPFEYFRRGCTVKAEVTAKKCFSREKTVERALSAVGSGKGTYNLAFHNCEHFANWCKYGEEKSLQVERAIVGTVGLMAVSVIAVAGLAAGDADI